VAKRASRKDHARHVRVDFRRNRQKPPRRKQWVVPDEQNELAEDTITCESIRAKGELSRRRTVAHRTEPDQAARNHTASGTVVAVRGQYVEVDDGRRIWPCTVRRVLRTRLIRERSPVVVGDRVSFAVVADSKGVLNEGVIERVHPRRTSLSRSQGRQTHMIAANVDQVLIVVSIREPMIKPHLIDRYLVAAHAGRLPAVICVNKVDLDHQGQAPALVERYARLGYPALATSAVTGDRVDALRTLLAGKVTLLAGQSGVGKSSLLNVVQPGLNLRTARVSTTTEKGLHTTTTAVWIKLQAGGAVIDTPGIRALDVAVVPIHELEMHFVEFVDRLAHCRYPNCIHIHEDDCAIKKAVEAGQIDPSRYDSYRELFPELSEASSYEHIRVKGGMK